MRAAIPLIAALAFGVPIQAGETEFVVESQDGTEISGVSAIPDLAWNGTVVVMVAGTGLFDRDVAFGRSGTSGDRLFLDLANRFVARGLAVVRYDRRGVRFGAQTPAKMLDLAIAASSTTESQREDLAAVRAWAESPKGLQAKCVILFGHSEGVLHIARLAASGAAPPLMVMGVGAPLRSPKEIVRWQIAERDAYSLKMMDINEDGEITNAEVEAQWRQTPSSFADNLAPLLHPAGRWTGQDIEQVRTIQSTIYERMRTAALELDDAAPYPNATTPMAKASWWKSWFIDETATAAMLSAWNVPSSFHWGTMDSQTPPEFEAPLANALLGKRAKVTTHSQRGHSLGEHALYAPMDDKIADDLADELAAASASCGN